VKLVVFSDLHAHAFPEFGATERLIDCLSVLTDIRKWCVKHGVKHVFFGGDLFHKRGVLWTLPYVAVANELVLFREAGIAFYAVDGNHDHEDKDGKTHALQPLIAGGLIRGINACGFRVVELDDCCVTMFAYCESRDVLAKRIQRAQKRFGLSKRNIALFHHGFKGARVGSTLEYEVPEPIDARALHLHRLFGLVLSGHYHTHQSIQGVRRGWYIGSPLEHTRSDRSEERKGFLVVDTTKLTFKRVALKRPRFVTVELPADPSKHHPALLHDVKGNFVDVVYASADESLDACLAEVKRLGARGVNPIPLPSAKQVHSVKRLNVSPTLSPVKVLRRYVKHRLPDIKKQGMRRADVLRLGLQLLREQ
jgi:DNA repair exonuclease SbcCD nuclease subunit